MLAATLFKLTKATSPALINKVQLIVKFFKVAAPFKYKFWYKTAFWKTILFPSSETLFDNFNKAVVLAPP